MPVPDGALVVYSPSFSPPRPSMMAASTSPLPASAPPWMVHAGSSLSLTLRRLLSVAGPTVYNPSFNLASAGRRFWMGGALRAVVKAATARWEVNSRAP